MEYLLIAMWLAALIFVGHVIWLFGYWRGVRFAGEAYQLADAKPEAFREAALPVPLSVSDAYVYRYVEDRLEIAPIESPTRNH